MGLFSIFSKDPEDLANKGDDLFEAKQYASAVRQYEKALDRHQKNPRRPNFNKIVSKKILDAKKALAKQHLDTAATLMESSCYEDATELLNLALELSGDPAVSDTGKRMLEDIRSTEMSKLSEDLEDGYVEDFDDDPEDLETLTEEDFDESEEAFALFGSLPEEEQDAYETYGQAFMRGFVALNQGDFERAADYLDMAMEENMQSQPDIKTHIPFELGTAYLNLGDFEKAKTLLEGYISDFPLSLKGYQIYCEILWGLKEYDQAISLLQSCPKEISHSSLITFLTGETLSQADNSDKAISLYKKYLKQNADDDVVLRALGNTYETTGDIKSAQKIYAQLMNSFTSCGKPADFDLKKRYADTSFAEEQFTVPVLELYLELATKDPEHRGEYFKKVSTIYKAIGNDAEAKRFEIFAGDDNRQ